MEATLSLHHHLSPKSLMTSQTTKYSTSTTTTPAIYHQHQSASSRFPGIHLQATHVQRLPPRPHVLRVSSVIIGESNEGMKIPKRKVERSTSTRCLSLSSLRRGKVVLEGMSDAKRALLDPRLLDNAETDFALLLKEEKIDWDKLQRVAWKMEMSGKEDKAVRMLKERYSKEVKEETIYAAYELGLLLVEMMIYEGNSRPARRICTALIKDRPTHDARPLLYLAVTNALLGAKQEAEKYWKEFTDIQDPHGKGAESTTPIEGLEKQESTLTFEQFIEHMEVFAQEIALG